MIHMGAGRLTFPLGAKQQRAGTAEGGIRGHWLGDDHLWSLSGYGFCPVRGAYYKGVYEKARVAFDS